MGRASTPAVILSEAKDLLEAEKILRSLRSLRMTGDIRGIAIPKRASIMSEPATTRVNLTYRIGDPMRIKSVTFAGRSPLIRLETGLGR
jgi:hypothetical protein